MCQNPGSIFEDLFVLEIANNHWGQVERGLKIISDYGKVVRFNSVRAAIKFQFRDVDNFIHNKHRNRKDVRYIQKTLATKLSDNDYSILTGAVKRNGMLTMATPFDERSVDLCVQLNMDIIKIASSDINDWFLIEKIAKAKKPVIASTGGSSVKDMDDLVRFFDNRNIPFAINHCVSLYPTEDHELEMNQINYLRSRYPNHVIGFSTHEYHDWNSSMLIAYAKGARTFERHIDIDKDDIPVSKYCSLPYQIDEWFKSYHKARAMCGGSGDQKRIAPEREVKYLDELIRGVYAKRDLHPGQILTEKDVYLAIPLLKGQLSCREFIAGEKLIRGVQQDEPLYIDSMDSPYAYTEKLKAHMYERGISPEPISKEQADTQTKQSKVRGRPPISRN